MAQTIQKRAESPAPDCPTKLPVNDNLTDHVVTAFARTTGKRTMVVGHRGGFLGGPENSLKSFQNAIENNLEAIEFDVSV